MDTTTTTLQLIETGHQIWDWYPDRAIASKEKIAGQKTKIRVGIWFKRTEYITAYFCSERKAKAFMATLCLLYGTKTFGIASAHLNATKRTVKRGQ